jgi:RNA polymerase sigma-B factor
MLPHQGLRALVTGVFAVMTEVACRSTPARAGLDGCRDLELVDVVQSLPPGSPARTSAFELLLGRHQALVGSCVRRYRDSPEPHEDLMQVGYLGLLRAINNFDPAIGSNLAAYAQACIRGEIKRHFRDNRWQVHVRRSTQELRLQMRRARAELTQRLSRTPADADLARYLKLTDEELLDVGRADRAFEVYSLDAPLSGENTGTLAEVIGAEDPRLELSLDIAAVWTHMSELSARDQRVLFMRFYGNMSQSEIARQLGISQMHVSRLQRAALGYLRERILCPEAEPGDGGRLAGPPG